MYVWNECSYVYVCVCVCMYVCVSTRCYDKIHYNNNCSLSTISFSRDFTSFCFFINILVMFFTDEILYIFLELVAFTCYMFPKTCVYFILLMSSVKAKCFGI